MNKILIALTIVCASNAQALDCITDAECVSATITLIRKAAKLDACKQESIAAAKRAEDILQPNDGSIEALEECVNDAVRADKFKKLQVKRIERLNKALKGS